MHFIKSKLLFSLPFYFAFSPNFEKGKIFSIHNWSSIFLQLEWVHAVRATHIISNSRIYLENLSFIRVLRIFYYKCIFVLKEKFNLQSWKRRRRDRDAATQQEKWEVARHTPMREVKQTKLQKNVKWQNIFSWKSLFGVCFSQFFFFLSFVFARWFCCNEQETVFCERDDATFQHLTIADDFRQRIYDLKGGDGRKLWSP